MAKKIFLDIETAPPDRSAPHVFEKVKDYSEEEYRKLSLDAEYARIICIALIIEEEDRIIHRGTLGRDRQSMKFHLDEPRTLRAFWKLVRDFDPFRDIFVGWNILDFDLHTICMRSVIHQVKPSIDLKFRRWVDKPIYDCMWCMENWRRRISLDEAAKVLGLQTSKTDEVDGSKVWDLFLEGRHQEICDYAMRDTELTRAIYYRLHYLREPELRES
jgi:predicted PolB exonuclease-like 3'-5' exonuclease